MGRSSKAEDLDIIHVRTSLLLRYCDPFQGCWLDIERPITLEEVQAGLDDVPKRPLAAYEARWFSRSSAQLMDRVRRDHIRRISWFVRNGFQDPIEVDVGVPSLGYYNTHLIVDGNHRFAAAVYRTRTLGEDPVLPMAISGSMEHALKLGFPP